MKRPQDKLGIAIAALGIIASAYGLGRWLLPLYASKGLFLETAKAECAATPGCQKATVNIVATDDGTVHVAGVFFMQPQKRSSKGAPALPSSIAQALQATAAAGHPLFAKYRRSATTEAHYVR